MSLIVEMGGGLFILIDDLFSGDFEMLVELGLVVM